jgi:hypothetical protein
MWFARNEELVWLCTFIATFAASVAGCRGRVQVWIVALQAAGIATFGMVAAHRLAEPADPDEPLLPDRRGGLLDVRQEAAVMHGWAMLAACLLLVAVSAFGQSLQPDWIADARTGCRVWDANPQPDESIKWTGACRNKLAQGRGVLQWLQSGKPGPQVKGRWQDGKMNGHGKVTLATGERFDGQWKNDMKNGHGMYTYANGDRYDGQYRDDQKDGHGVYTYADASRYDGEWRDGKKNCRGTEVRADGSRYDGEWRDNLPNGRGIAAWLNGDRYAGMWVLGCYRSGSRTAAWGVDLASCR